MEKNGDLYVPGTLARHTGRGAYLIASCVDCKSGLESLPCREQNPNSSIIQPKLFHYTNINKHGHYKNMVWVYVCVCVYIYIFIYIYVYICVCVFCIYIYMCVYVYIYVCMRVCMRVCMYTYIYICVYIYKHIRVYIYIYIYMSVCVHALLKCRLTVAKLRHAVWFGLFHYFCLPNIRIFLTLK